MTGFRIWARDTLRIRLAVTNDDGAALNLTGATVAAVVRSGDTYVALTAAVTDGPGGLAELSLPANTLAPGGWALQCWVTRAGETQTVLDTALKVVKSFPTP